MLKGSRTLRQRYIIWSSRIRGSVQRSHIWMKTRKNDFEMITTAPSRLAHERRPGDRLVERRDARVPAAEEQHDGDRRHEVHLRVLGEEEDREPHPRVLGVEARHELGLGLGQVEGRALALGELRDERDHERDPDERVAEQEPVRDPALPAPRRGSVIRIEPASTITVRNESASGIS